MIDSPDSNILIGLGDSKLTLQTREKEKLETPYIWKSCCFQADKRIVLFLSQFSIGLMVICFSLYQLNKDNTCEHQQVYVGLLTMMVGVFLPAPRINK